MFPLMAMRVPSAWSLWLTEVMHRAQQTTDTKLEVIACVLQKSATQVSRMVYGKEGFALQDFLALTGDAQTAAFAREVLKEMAAVFGVVDWDTTLDELRIAMASVERKRMAKASLGAAQRREVA